MFGACGGPCEYGVCISSIPPGYVCFLYMTGFLCEECLVTEYLLKGYECLDEYFL